MPAAPAPEIPATPVPAEAVEAAVGSGVPQPGSRLTSDGLTALMRDPAAFAAYEDAGGKAELDRVTLEESKGRRA